MLIRRTTLQTEKYVTVTLSVKQGGVRRWKEKWSGIQGQLPTRGKFQGQSSLWLRTKSTCRTSLIIWVQSPTPSERRELAPESCPLFSTIGYLPAHPPSLPSSLSDTYTTHTHTHPIELQLIRKAKRTNIYSQHSLQSTHMHQIVQSFPAVEDQTYLLSTYIWYLVLT